MSEWKEYKLGDVLNLISGGTSKTSIPEYWNGDIPWLSVSDFNNGQKYVCCAEKSITQLGLNKSSTNILKKGQIIISARGTVGVISMLGRDMAFNQSNYGIDAKKEISDNHFLYYLLKNIVPVFLSNSYGAVFNTITKITFDHITINLPPLSEQKAIAEVLSSLDDKIDLLHRQNKTLEQMAETLFRQWFVEEAEEDWEVGELGDIVTVVDNRGKTPPNTKEKTPYPLIEVNALGKENRLVDYSVIRKYVDKEIFESWFRNTPKKYDTLLSTVGSIGAISMYVLETGNVAQNVIGLSAKNISSFYLYQFLRYRTNEILLLDIGGVQPSIKVPHLLSLKIFIPPAALQKKFDYQIKEFISKMEINYLQIHTLEKLRDTLLPKLMSGEVRVRI